MEKRHSLSAGRGPLCPDNSARVRSREQVKRASTFAGALVFPACSRGDARPASLENRRPPDASRRLPLSGGHTPAVHSTRKNRGPPLATRTVRRLGPEDRGAPPIVAESSSISATLPPEGLLRPSRSLPRQVFAGGRARACWTVALCGRGSRSVGTGAPGPVNSLASSSLGIGVVLRRRPFVAGLALCPQGRHLRHPPSAQIACRLDGLIPRPILRVRGAQPAAFGVDVRFASSSFPLGWGGSFPATTPTRRAVPPALALAVTYVRFTPQGGSRMSFPLRRSACGCRWEPYDSPRARRRPGPENHSPRR